MNSTRSRREADINHFRFLTHLDTVPVMARLFKMQPAQWAGCEARGEPDICRSKSVLLRHHDEPTQDNWLEDLPLKDDPILTDWMPMRKLLAAARAVIKADQRLKTVLDPDKPHGRIMLCGLTPGNAVQWHTDIGPYHSRHIRFHIPLITNPACCIHVLNEQVHMEVGSLWWFNNWTTHCAVNWGKTHRTHLIFEMPVTMRQDAEAA